MKASGAEVKALARELGFEPVGITATDPLLADEERALSRVNGGLMSGLDWFTMDRVRRACRPCERFPWARSILALAWPYYPVVENAPQTGNPSGSVARYAWGADYHKLIGGKLLALAAALRSIYGEASARGYVDTAAIAERALAVRAGVGWFGKNTNVLTTRNGSWVLLAELLTGLDIEPDRPIAKSCGQCRHCLSACPTGAIVAPYVIDNARCISYLTIELRGGIPRHLREQVGDHVFGCDICQEVCPVNRLAELRVKPVSRDLRWPRLDLIPLLKMDEAEYRERFRGSALKRAGLAGLRRNAALVLGNLRATEGTATLGRWLEDGDPALRAQCAWSLGRMGGSAAKAMLERRRKAEGDVLVREEIDLALSHY